MRSRRPLPADREVLAAFIDALAASPGFRGIIPHATVDAWTHECGASAASLMLRLLPLAARYADPPVSDFRVGAVAQGRGGDLYLGANLEIAGAPPNASLHAEQAAVLSAWDAGEDGLTRLAVSAAPCGHCRQFLLELADAGALEIVLGSPDAPSVLPLRSLLPHAFGPAELGSAGALMHTLGPPLALEQVGGPLVQAALEAAERSYAPYSSTRAGLALQTAGGLLVAGRAAESVAYNPGVPPLQAALALLRLAGAGAAEIEQAALVETVGPISYRATTGATLGLVAPRARLRAYTARRDTRCTDPSP